MKQLVLITGIILIACVLISGLAPSPAAPAAPDNTGASSPAAEQGFTVGDFGGRVAVYGGGGAEPLLVTDTLTDSLPRADARKIRGGIYAADRRELEKLLEDLCS